MITSKDFYSKFAASYAAYAEKRKEYVLAVNKYILSSVSKAETLVDVGAGNGQRAKEISQQLGISDITLIDNSDGMLSFAKAVPGVKIIKADISDEQFSIGGKHDLVLCLWNVIGHIPTVRERQVAIRNLSKLLSPKGALFIDVNNRYNVLQYGFINVLKNICRDLFRPTDINGDFNLKITTNGEELTTCVHIFNPQEISRLFKDSNLKVVDKKYIDYKTGKERRTRFSGQLVYKLIKT